MNKGPKARAPQRSALFSAPLFTVGLDKKNISMQAHGL